VTQIIDTDSDGRGEVGSFDPALDDAGLLEAVIGHYRAALAEAPTVTGWLTEHGVRHGEVVETFGLGFSDRTLGLTIPIGARVAGRELRGRLQTLGVLRSTGHEQFRGCLVVPIRDAEGRVVQCYGQRVQRPQRRRDGETPEEMLWLSGSTSTPSTGIWHAQALAEAEVIVADTILDGLVWWSAGYRNVIAPGGPDGLPADLPDQLIEAGVTRVLLAQARTPAGEAAAGVLSAALAAQGLACFRVVFPHGCDASFVAVDGNDPTAVLGGRLRAAQWLGDGPAPSRQQTVTGDGPTTPPPPRAVRGPRPLPAAPGPHSDRPAAPVEQPPAVEELSGSTGTPTVTASPIPPPGPAPAGRDITVDGGELRVTIGALLWRVRGLDRVTGSGSLRVNLCVRHIEDDGRFHLDVLDLFSARARALFLKTAATELGVRDEERLRRDLGRVLLACEDRILDLQAEARTPTPVGPTMTVTEEQDALALLKDPQLLARIGADVAALGVVGEVDNALIAYLAATSRLLDTPLAVVVQSGSAAGKSTLTDAVLSLMPDEQRLAVSAMTGQSLFYLGETELAHKILSVAEVEGAERASYALKLLQSEGELSIASTGKDPVTGELVTKTYRVQGPVALFLTTTAPALDDELGNRCLVLGVEEDQAQTRAILAAQRQAQTVSGLLAKTEREQVRELHANAQRLLEPIAVVNPLAPSLSFGDGRTRARRDHAKFLTLIRAVTLLHQHQRPRKRVVRHGLEIVYLEATSEDVAVAERLAPLLFGGLTVADLAPQTRRLLALLDTLVSTEAKASRCRREDVRFTRRAAREYTGWSDFALRRHLSRLVELEFVAVHRVGNAFTHELLWTEPADTVSDRDEAAAESAAIGEYDRDLDALSRPSRGHLAVVSRTDES
jgi:DNA primase